MEDHSFVERHWRKMLFVVWLLIGVTFIWSKSNAIHWFSLGDTDDNLRIMQVRAWLNGQDWYDLRQYRLDPPGGADIHWSRLVDLPLAAIITVAKLFVDGATAEKVAVATAPLLPMLVVLLALGSAVRNLIGRMPFIEFMVAFLAMPVAFAQFAPLRIDHHGWQLACVALAIAGVAHPKRTQGGVILGLATSLSLVIGMEMLPYLLIAGAGTALRWVHDRNEASRLLAYGVTLAAGTGLGYLIFASNANQMARCDALSPVWLSAMMATGAVLAGVTMVKTDRWPARFALVAVAGIVLAIGFAMSWPQCLGKLEGISPELDKLWLSHVKEVRPVYKQSWIVIVTVGYAATLGILGALYGIMSGKRSGRSPAPAWAIILAMTVAAAAMLLWQTRIGAVAQLLSVAGVTAILAAVVPSIRASDNFLIRVLGTVAALVLISGIAGQHITGWLTAEPDVKAANAVSNSAKPVKPKAGAANASCSTIPSHAAIGRLPKALIFAPTDLNPRLITLTHHDGIAGPYHRNENAMLDIHHAFRGTPDEARAIITAHKATLVLICPHSAEGTIFNKESPGKFYDLLEKGKAPDWLEPVALPAKNPFKVWRVKK
jgi:hypothetical protein